MWRSPILVRMRCGTCCARASFTLRGQPVCVCVCVRPRTTAWLSGLYRATAVFVKIDCNEVANAATRDSLDRLQSLLSAIQHVLTTNHTALIKEFTRDDKGYVLVACFGLPPFMRARSESHAVLAATEISAALDSLGFTGAIGVATGMTFCGAVGSHLRQYVMCGGGAHWSVGWCVLFCSAPSCQVKWRRPALLICPAQFWCADLFGRYVCRELCIVGRPMVKAARLMCCAAPGTVMVDKTTMEESKDDVEYHELLPVILKGSSGPVPTYQPVVDRVDASAAVAPTMSLVGRRSERARLLASINRLWRGREGGCLW